MSLRELHNFDIRQGDFGQTSFAGVLGLARLRRITGTLNVEREKARKSIYFLDGLPVYCRSELPGESLRQVLNKLGIIDRAKVDEVEQAMAAEGIEEDQVLLRMGVLDESTRYSHLQTLARKRILACFQWSSGRYRFLPGEEFLENTDLFDIDPLDIIHEGISTYQGLNLAEEIQKVSTRQIEPVGDFQELEPFLERYHPGADLKSLVSGQKVFEALPLIEKDINQALALMYILIITGYIALDGHGPGDAAPADDEPVEADAPEIFDDAFNQGQASGSRGVTTYHMATSQREEVVPQSKPKAPAPQANRPTPPSRPTPTKPIPQAPAPPPRFQKKVLRAYDAANPHRQARPAKPIASPPADTSVSQAETVDPDMLGQFRKMAELVRTNDFYEMLGVMIETDRSEIKKAYFQKNQLYHQDRAKALGPLGEALSQQICDGLQKAYQALLSAEKRYEYEKGRFKSEQDHAWSIELRRELAKTQYRRGKWYMSQKRPDLALFFFDSTVKLDSDHAHYYTHLGWAQYSADKSKVSDARAFLKTSLGINSRDSETMYFVGMIEKDMGNEAEAYQWFDNAIKADPGNRLAKSEIEKLTPPKVKGEGIFGRLFKK